MKTISQINVDIARLSAEKTELIDRWADANEDGNVEEATLIERKITKLEGEINIAMSQVVELSKPKPRRITANRKSHTTASMMVEGTYIDGVTREEVEAEVKGTFGGRFVKFGGGKYTYIAYTD